MGVKEKATKVQFNYVKSDNYNLKHFLSPFFINTTNLIFCSGLPGQQKVALRLKQQTHKIVSSFKTNPVSCSYVKEFSGHKDGIWDVASARLGIPVVGTASAGTFLFS